MLVQKTEIKAALLRNVTEHMVQFTQRLRFDKKIKKDRQTGKDLGREASTFRGYRREESTFRGGQTPRQHKLLLQSALSRPWPPA
jgi:hypothetical protein